jgi:hypothetical protein
VVSQRTEVPGDSPAKQIAGFIAKFDPDVARVIRDCRRELRKRFPTATEIIYDNYNFLVFGFSTTGKPSDTIVSLAAASNGVGLSFYNGAAVPDPKGILLGSGKQNRFVRLPSAKTLRDPDVSALIAAATAQADPPLPRAGKGTTVVKSVSAKQRPRRTD